MRVHEDRKAVAVVVFVGRGPRQRRPDGLDDGERAGRSGRRPGPGRWCPGVWRIRSPTMGTIGAWTASIRAAPRAFTVSRMVVSGPERLSLLMTRRPGHRFAAALVACVALGAVCLPGLHRRASAPPLRSRRRNSLSASGSARTESWPAGTRSSPTCSTRRRAPIACGCRELGRTSRRPSVHGPGDQRPGDDPATSIATSSSSAGCTSRTVRRSVRERDEIFRQGKVVCWSPAACTATEIGATQMALELVHRLATDDSPATRKILDNVIVLLVPSANPDGQIAVTDWFNQNVGHAVRGEPAAVPRTIRTPATTATATCTCSRRRRASTWRSWRGRTGSRRCGWISTRWAVTGPRMFVMPATDPINPNVHPLDLPMERHPRPVAGGGARGRGQGAGSSTTRPTRTSGRARSRGAAGGTTRSACSPRSRAPASRRRSISSARPTAGRARLPAPAAAAGDAGPRRPASTRRPFCRRPTSRRAPSTRGRGSAAAGRSATSSTTASSRRWRCSRRWRIGARRFCGTSTRSTGRRSKRAGRARSTAILVPLDEQHDPREVGASRREAGLARRRRAPAEAPVRVGGPAVRGRDLRDPDDAGLCAVREGPARSADLS